jgi:hypothetical protein
MLTIFLDNQFVIAFNSSFLWISLMQNNSDEGSTLSGPKGRSLEAYKIWIRELVSRFTSDNTEIRLTENEWVRYWKEYWREHTNKS